MDIGAMTWATLASFAGLALFLGAVVVPIAKALVPAVTGRTTLVVCLISGVVIAELASFYVNGPGWHFAADAGLTGVLAAAAATGLHQAKLGATNALPQK